MLTKTAEIDLKALRDAGFSPTDAEVVKLNDLALEIERGRDTTPANHPRFAFAGSVVLHEPTIGALEWWVQFGKDAAFTNDGRLMTYFFMMAHARNVDYLNTLERASDIRKAVKEWKKRVDATQEELWRACLYVKHGDESAGGDPTVHTSLTEDEALDIMWNDLIQAAGALHLRPDDLKTMTHSALLDTLIQASVFAHVPMKKSVAGNYIAYRQLLRKIEERSKEGEKTEEKENG